MCIRADDMSGNLNIRAMQRDEVDRLVGWAAEEGWNPGTGDAAIFWANDPHAFIAAELDGELIGGGAITAYGDSFGFMGFFLMRPEFRGRGLGNRLWLARRDRLRNRLAPGATIGMDGVAHMQDYYARGGFVFSHRNLRFCGQGGEAGTPDALPAGSAIVPLTAIDPAMLAAYERSCFPAPRPVFLKHWITGGDRLALGLVRDGALAGYGVVRTCRVGCKIGPLFADDEAAADALLTRLTEFASGGPVFLDVPETHAHAMALAGRHGMEAVFGCARMYLGPVPQIREDRVFGVTTFEVG